MKRLFSFLTLALILSCCVPKEQVVLRKIRNVVLDTIEEGTPLLSGEAVFYNPNSIRIKLKEINIEVFVDGEKSAHADQRLNSVIPSRDEFTVPLKIRLTLKKIGLWDTMLNILSGKKYEIHYKGYIRVQVHGIGVKVPVDYTDEIRLKI
jgi:LEA14-like dessication related protein